MLIDRGRANMRGANDVLMSCLQRHPMKGSFWRSLIAVLLGNAIYFGVMRFLPERAQHQMFRVDWGTAVDFWICLVCYGLLRLMR